jgi:hypothetical protein
LVQRKNWPAPLPPRDRPRVGRNKFAILRALRGYGVIFTTAQLFEHCYPRLAGSRQPRWRWQCVRDAAQRVGMVRNTPRTRPLTWRLPD